MVAKKTMAALFALILGASAFAQDARVYVGARLGGSIGLTAQSDTSKTLFDKDNAEYYNGAKKYRSGGGSFDVAPFISVQLADIFALQTELLFTQFGISRNGGYKYTDDVKDKAGNVIKDEDGKVRYPKGDGYYQQMGAVVIPILAQVTLLERKIKISAGPHFTINQKGDYVEITDGKKRTRWGTYEYEGLSDLGYKFPVVGLTAGASFGFNVGESILFFDVRYITDLGSAKYTGYKSEWNMEQNKQIYTKTEEVEIGRRAKLAFSVGYEFGAGSR